MLPLAFLLLAAAGQVPALPPRLSQTGFDPRPGSGLLAYSPRYPLWSDGAAKSRWLRLPPGGRIDDRDPGDWKFPVGTRFWKEFRFNGRKVETRLLWRATAGRWVFASYRWRENQQEADLVPPGGLDGAADLGGGLSHRIPSRADCEDCHVNRASPVLGFTALQLSPDRDPLAPHAEPALADLRALEDRKLLDPPRPELLEHPPRIQAPTPRGRAALGYLAANCGQCHTPEAPIRGVALILAHRDGADPEPGWATTVARPSHFRLPGREEGGSMLVSPGHPEDSTLVYRMESRHPAAQMPPLGTVLPDQVALALIRAWIRDDLAAP